MWSREYPLRGNKGDRLVKAGGAQDREGTTHHTYDSSDVGAHLEEQEDYQAV